MLLGSIISVHRRRGDLRAAARLDAAPQAGADARGRGRLQRPGRRPARDRLHRVDPAAGLRRARHARAVRARARDRRGGRAGRGLAGRAGPAQRAAREPPASTRSRRWPPPALAFGAARQPARLRLPRRLPGRARARLGAHPRQADGHGLPPGPRLGGADRDVPRARAARVPEPARRRLARGHRARARARVHRAAAGGGARHRVRPLHRRPSASCSAGPACAARCRWCSPPSR